MHSWKYEINDVLRITYKGQEVLARVAGYVDSLDNAKPLYINLRISDGQAWGQRKVKIQPEQIIEPLPNWYEEQHAKWEAELKAHVDEVWSKMTPADKRRVHEEAVALGFAQERRSPLDIMIDRACGIE